MGPERKVEAALVAAVRQRGGVCVKLAPTVAGLPDRLVLLPNGVSGLVELKSATGALRPVQVIWHAKAHALGHSVQVIRSTDQIEPYLDLLSTLMVE